ncbi:MAG: MFS transporter [Gemmatimonadales bacterium]|nr:MFS transporter [Gemmatimonadales bacterium]HQW66487.1 MFS transporter [Gemmatimonadales bacterium]
MNESASTGPKRAQLQQLWVLIAVNFVDMLGFAIILPLLPFYALRLDATPEMVGWMIASFSIAQLIASPIWGRVSDRYGRRPALIIGLAASSIAFLVFGLADSLWLLFLSRIVQGAGGGTTGVAQAYVSDTVAPADRARALGWLSAATAAGVMVGPAIGSGAAHFGRAAPGFIAAALCFLNALAAWRWLPESRSAEDRAVPRPRKPIWHAAYEVLRHPAGKAARLIWIYGTGMLAFSLLTSILALWLDARFGVTEKTIGWFFVYNGMLSLVLRSLFLGPVVDRIGEMRAMRLGALILAVGLMLYTVAPNLWVLAAMIPLVPIGTALLFPASTSLLSHATDPSELGTTMGVAQTFAGIARIIAPIAGTIAFQRIGVNAPFLLGGLTMLGVAWVSWRFVRPLPRVVA